MPRAFPCRPRIAEAVRAAAIFLADAEAALLPIDPYALARSYGWRVQPFSRAADRLQLSLSEFRTAVGTHEAFTAMRRRPVIFFNDAILSRERIAFSLCHEIGHIVLRHFADFRPDALTHAQLTLLDEEANAFAANLLAPPAVVHAISPETRPRCRDMFSMSQTAWLRRLATLETDLSSLPDDVKTAQLAQFDAWMHAVRCRECGLRFHGGRGCRCPACGSPRLTWEPQRCAARLIYPWQENAWRSALAAPPPARTRIMLQAELDNPMAD